MVMIFAFSGCKNNVEVDEITDQNFQKIEENGIMKVGIVASKEPPMAFVDENYNIVGFDMDLAKEMELKNLYNFAEKKKKRKSD